MGKVITVMNMKGGVGKTTVAMHLGGMICRYQFNDKKPKKVLLIDYDPQFNLTQAFIPPKTYFSLEDRKKTTLSILLEDDTIIDPYKLQVPGNELPPEISDIVYKIYNFKDGRKLDLIPSTLNLMYVALAQPNTNTSKIEERFNKFIAKCRLEYDYILIDCHPAGSLFTQTSLRNSDHVLIPVIPQRYSVRGIGLMMQFIKVKKDPLNNPKPHILFNHTSRTGISTDEKSIRDNPRFKKYCLLNSLKKFKAFSDPIEGKDFVWTSSKPYSTFAFQNLYTVTQEFINKISTE